MQKQIIGKESPREGVATPPWFDLSSIAKVELTSEDPERTIENALSAGVDGGSDGGVEGGWKAATAGQQIIRLLFKEAQHVRRIHLEFTEYDTERNQEFALHYIQEGDAVVREIRRQQWTFSPQGSVREVEDYSVDLRSVKVLQLTIDPDRGRDSARATLKSLSVA